jgi:hypothetical protein
MISGAFNPKTYRSPVDDLATINTGELPEAVKSRRLRRQVRLLTNLISGGWIVEFEPRQHLGLQNSTRPERRRIKLGRS